METPYKQKILIVEDDQQISRMLTTVLEKTGFQVKSVECGTLAIRDATAARPDLVILDLNLPDMSGLQVCRELRSLYHPSVVPIIMFTGMNQPIDQLRGFAHGADAYLTKPCEMTELVGTVGSLLDQSYHAPSGGETFPVD